MVGFINIDDLKSWKRISCLFTMIGALLFLILTFVAMLTFPIPYNFGGHYFSTLGITHEQIGILSIPNPVSSVIFLIAMLIAGASLIPFWIIIRELFVDIEGAVKIATVGTIFGLISSPLAMGVGIFPGDVAQFLHTLSANGFFISISIGIFLYSIAIFKNDKYPNPFAYLGFAIAIIVVLYVFNAFEFADPLFQKICVYSFIIWAFIQSNKVWQEVAP
ncbi:MAG: hypothetical protein ACTSRG_08520 [Candidatus Helarchaeota archaeon]